MLAVLGASLVLLLPNPVPAHAAHRIQNNVVTQENIVTPEKAQAINRLLKITGMDKLQLQIIDQMIAQMKAQPAFQSIPDEFWSKFRQKVNTQGLTDLLIPIYSKYYTLADVNDLIAWYQTPLGKKVVTSMPGITKESMQAGTEWGQKLAQDVVHEMDAEGIKPPQQ
jgi:hypothetical protein